MHRIADDDNASHVGFDKQKLVQMTGLPPKCTSHVVYEKRHTLLMNKK